jgi:hypothetical protein
MGNLFFNAITPNSSTYILKFKDNPQLSPKLDRHVGTSMWERSQEISFSARGRTVALN